MNLFSIFCYITLMCESPAPQPAQTEPKQNLTPVANNGRIAVRQTASYPTRYDYIDVEAVMSNERIIKILFNCVLNRGPCTREGLELKRIIPDAIQTECSKCTERQRIQAGKVLAHLLHNKPEYWKILVEKFDPNNVYLRKFMADEDEDEKSLQKFTNNTSVQKIR